MALGSSEALAISIVSAVGVHVVLYGVLEMAGNAAPRPKPGNVSEVDFEIAPPPPPEPEPEKPEEIASPPPPPPPPVVETQPKPQPRRVAEIRSKDPQPPPPPVVTSEPPAPGPPAADNAPPADVYVYKMPADSGGGTMVVMGGSGPTGSPRGVRGGKGTGDGGGGAPDGEGTGGPRVVSVAAVKQMPQPLGDYDFIDKIRNEYPETAKRDGIEGDVVVRILVDEQGRVGEARVVKGPRKDLNDKAVELAKKIRFKPGIDTDGNAVAVRISWTFHFVLPDD